MRVDKLTLADIHGWATLLALAFDRTPGDMEKLLHWLHDSFEVLAWGAWLDDQLVAQYACLLRRLYVPALAGEVRVGMSVNMAVHPDYRGRGLIKHIAQPVYETVSEAGGVAGVGFSNAAGVKVDRRSSSYGYQVCGQLTAFGAWLPFQRHSPPLELTDELVGTMSAEMFLPTHAIHFVQTQMTLERRYRQHPFRRYRFGVWREGACIYGVVIYRHVRLLGVPAVALLGAYSVDLRELLRRWTATIRQTGITLVHLLSAPQGSLGTALAHSAPLVALPFIRTPYYLTVKPLNAALAPALFNFEQWDCAGGDVL